MKRVYYYLLALTTLTLPRMIFARTNITLPEDTYGLPTTDGKGLPVIAGRVIVYLSGMIASVSVVFMLYGAFMYMTAMGDDSKVEKVKKTMGWNIFGLIIAIFAWSIVNLLLDLEPLDTSV